MVKPTDSSQNGSSQKEHTQVIKEAFEGLRSFTSSPSYKAALSILDELASLQTSLTEKEKELSQAKDEIKKREETQNTAISAMVKANEKELAKQEVMQAKIDALEAATQEKDKLLKEKDEERERLIKDRDEEKEKLIKDRDEEKEKLGKEREEETGKLKDEIKTLTDTNKVEAEKLEKANGEITELQKTLKERDERIDKMKQVFSDMKTKLKDTSAKVKELEEKVSSLDSSLQTSEKERIELKSLFVEFTNEQEETVIDQFEELWQLATKEVWSLLKDDLPLPNLQNSTAWGHFRDEAEEILGEKLKIKLPNSNTPAAKAMRLAVVLVMLTREIDANLFQPTYFEPEEGEENEEEQNFREFSATKLAVYDNEREAYCRSLLLSIKPDMQAQQREQRIQQVVKKVSDTFSLILPDTRKAEMDDRVKTIVNKAADIWKQLQRAKTRYETDFEPSIYGDVDYEEFKFPNDSEGEDLQAKELYDSINLLTVFPRISKISTDGRQGLNWVYQVRSMTRLCLEAGKEVMRDPPPSPVDRRRLVGRRRDSLAMNGAGQQNGNGHANGEKNGKEPFLDKSKSA